jgi:cobalamin biosynthesis Mg chelatase CobN
MLARLTKTEDKAMADHLNFFSTGLRTREKEDVEVFQEIFSDLIDAVNTGEHKAKQKFHQKPALNLIPLNTAHKRACAFKDSHNEEGSTEVPSPLRPPVTFCAIETRQLKIKAVAKAGAGRAKPVKVPRTLATMGMSRPSAQPAHSPLAQKAAANAKIVKTGKKTLAVADRARKKAQREANKTKAQEAKKAAEEKERMESQARASALQQRAAGVNAKSWMMMT